MIASTDRRRRRVEIYGLCATDEPHRIRYVGQSNAPATRFNYHVSRDGLVREWIGEVRRRGAHVDVVLLGVCFGDSAMAAEARWIRIAAENGGADLNIKTVDSAHP